MNQEQIKNAESIVKTALEIYADKQEQWDNNIETITKEAFKELRLKSFHEGQLIRHDRHIETLNKELRQHQQAIRDLRGYIGFLEDKNFKLERDTKSQYE